MKKRGMTPAEPAPEIKTEPAAEEQAEAAGKKSRRGKRSKGAAPAEKRPRRRMTMKERLLLLIPAAAAVVAVLAVFLLNRGATRLTLDGSPCQYYGGNLYRIESGAVLLRTSDDETQLQTSSGTRTVTSLPIYYEDKQVVTLPEDMVYYAPRTGIYGRLEYFTELHYQTTNGIVKAVKNGKETTLQPGFLYDGGDLYLFLEPVILSFNGYQLELPAMSYVEAVYTGDVMAFNFDAKEFLIEAPTGAATAKIASGDYTVSLLGDSMELYDGSRTLLFTRPELLDTVGD